MTRDCRPLSRMEQETVLCRAADEDTWTVSCADPAVQRKLIKLFGPGEPMNPYEIRWYLPKTAVSFRKPREASPAQRAAMAKARAAQRSP